MIKTVLKIPQTIENAHKTIELLIGLKPVKYPSSTNFTSQSLNNKVSDRSTFLTDQRLLLTVSNDQNGLKNTTNDRKRSFFILKSFLFCSEKSFCKKLPFKELLCSVFFMFEHEKFLLFFSLSNKTIVIVY
jgi:hypothetical protein